jgi:hypothetical protein
MPDIFDEVEQEEQLHPPPTFVIRGKEGTKTTRQGRA